MNNSGKSPHILNASSSLVGFSFVVLTGINSLGVSDKTHIDEIAGIAIALFTFSCIFSFLSIRENREHQSKFYETIADCIFLGGLLLLFVLSGLVEFKIIY
jgi:hypothetical protein